MSIDTLPGGDTWTAYPGQQRTVVFGGWPAGYLTGRTFEVRIVDQTPVVCTVDDTAHTVTATVTVPNVASWRGAVELWDTTTNPDEVRVRLDLRVYKGATADPSALTVTVQTVDQVAINLTVSLAAVASVNGKVGAVSLTAADVGADASGTAGTAVSAHVAAVDPHGDRAYTDSAVAGEASTRSAADALLAPLDSPALTGNPTAPTQIAGSNNSRLANTAFVAAATAALIDAAPGALDTLNELAAALGDDPNFATTITNAIAAKVSDGTYPTGWDTDTSVAPSRNALYDIISTLAKADASNITASVWRTALSLASAGGDLSGAFTALSLVATANVEAIIRANTLNQMAAPTGNLPMGGFKLVSVANGSADTDSAAYGQVDDGVFGDGSDGDVTFDGVATILGIAPSGGSVYTLNRDVYLGNCTINSGINVITAGFRVFVKGTLAGPGTIHGATAIRDGGAFGAGVAGTGGTATIDGGQNGGTGGTGVGASTANRATCRGGRGGAGGSGGSGAGGTAGTVTAPTAAIGTVHALPWAVMGMLFSATTTTPTAVLGGTGGGSGAGDGTNKGGAGGASGGLVIVAARNISSVAAPLLEANGGNGESVAVGNCGGGGGGGGGLVVVVSKDSTVPTVTVAGGSGGAKSGTGVAGAAGSTGTIIRVRC